MVNIVKFAQFYCIYLLSSAQMSAEEKQIRCFYKKTIYSMAVLSDMVRILYTAHICWWHTDAMYPPHNFIVYCSHHSKSAALLKRCLYTVIILERTNEP